MLQQALKAKSVLHEEAKPWRDRVLEARALLDDIVDAGTNTFASQVRRALAEDNRRVHAHLAGLCDIEFAGAAGWDRIIDEFEEVAFGRCSLVNGRTAVAGSALRRELATILQSSSPASAATDVW
jgi:hypothetical protein